MLFNSYDFIFVFLPATLIGFWLISGRLHLWLLTVASIIFYSWWDIRYAPLLLSSIAVNYLFGLSIVYARRRDSVGTARLLTILAIILNLGLLGAFKYFAFVVAVAERSTFIPLTHQIPLGISFFTFTQIAYLVDAYKGDVEERDPLGYALFVTWFPHLIAGPLLHHREMMPQFRENLNSRIRNDNIALGLTIFLIGLFKKVVLADNVGAYIAPSNPLSPFTKAASGLSVEFFEAWTAALAYTCQLYFDFSGYSDMAIGLSAMFGVRLPANFNSPYKAINIADFWRRWHITLSRFLRDYVYIPLGGNRSRRDLNIVITFLLGGIWHGAGWTFVVWGLLHGAYFLVFRAYQSARKFVLGERSPFPGGKFAAHATTFIAVVVGWVYFRSDTMSAANTMIASMFGLRGVSLTRADQSWLGSFGWLTSEFGFNVAAGEIAQPVFPILFWVVGLLGIAWLLPNTQQIMVKYPITLPVPGYVTAQDPLRFLRWRPSILWAVGIAVLGTVAVANIGRPTQFLYFQF